MRSTLFALIALLAAPVGLAAPVAWRAVPAASRIGFTAYWQGTAVEGQFKRFEIHAQLDPAHPAGGKIGVTIATASVATSSADITHALQGAEWFDVKRYPAASFTSATLAQRADGGFGLGGKLRLKGHTKTVAFPLKIAQQGTQLRLTGRLELNRDDFGIGAGRWAGGGIIATRVEVVFAVVLTRAQ